MHHYIGQRIRSQRLVLDYVQGASANSGWAQSYSIQDIRVHRVKHLLGARQDASRSRRGLPLAGRDGHE